MRRNNHRSDASVVLRLRSCNSWRSRRSARDNNRRLDAENNRRFNADKYLRSDAAVAPRGARDLHERSAVVGSNADDVPARSARTTLREQ
jgi:hypothetical protein